MRSVPQRTVWLGVLALLGGVTAGAAAQQQQQGGTVTTPDQIDTLPGFKVEVVLKADKDKHGSWISMAKDGKGRLLLGGQRGQPVTRLTVKDGQVEKEEVLKLPVSETMGMLYVKENDSLYVDGSDGKAFGLFRLKDTDGDDQYDKSEMLREWKGGAGEHGAHGILLGKDGRLYIVAGNFVDVPNDVLPSSPHRNYADDLVLPRAEDGNGFGAGKKPPGGFILRTDLDGKNAELYASGQRNTYDIAFNADGELMGWDSDMEWDWGMPWYRPIRVFHATSGADMGFREGSAKYPEYYYDSLPPAVPIGLGSPTGAAFGYGARFPAKYQKAMYVLDWTYGRLIAVHLTPKGSSYGGSWENFVAPRSLHATSGKTPLNLTDAVIGDDGSMYFTIGGRSTQAALYRVSYAGEESTAQADYHDADGQQARDERRALEKFHGRQDPKAVEAAWPHLKSEDRFIRWAARIAIESQPVEQWKQQALDEKDPRAALEALLALSRYGGKDVQPALLKALAGLPIAALPEELKLEKLRLIEVTTARQGKPEGELAKQLIAELDPIFPSPDVRMNRELSQTLLALGAPDAVAKTVKRLQEAPTQEEQIAYVHALRTVKDGWTPGLRKAYFQWWARDWKKEKGQHPTYVMRWFDDAGRPYDNGSSFDQFIGNFNKDARKTLSADEAQALEPVLALYTAPERRQNRPQQQQAKPRAVVKEWKMADLEPVMADASKGRNFRRGREAFQAAQCAQCHRFADASEASASVGPDLTAVASRYQRRDILESILDPNKVVSEQYQNTAFRLKNGSVVIGRVIEENDERVVVQPDMLKPEKVEVKKSDVDRRAASKVSPMPEGLANVLTKDEILDLLAYLESGGRRDHPAFARQEQAQ